MYVQVKTRGDHTSETGRCVTKAALTCFTANWPVSFSTMSECRNARRTARAHRHHTRLRCRRKSMSMFCPGQPQGAKRGDVAASRWASAGLRNQRSPWTRAHFHQLLCNRGTSCSDLLSWAILCPYVPSLQNIILTIILFYLYIYITPIPRALQSWGKQALGSELYLNLTSSKEEP